MLSSLFVGRCMEQDVEIRQLFGFISCIVSLLMVWQLVRLFLKFLWCLMKVGGFRIIRLNFLLLVSSCFMVVVVLFFRVCSCFVMLFFFVLWCMYFSVSDELLMLVILVVLVMVVCMFQLLQQVNIFSIRVFLVRVVMCVRVLWWLKNQLVFCFLCSGVWKCLLFLCSVMFFGILFLRVWVQSGRFFSLWMLVLFLIMILVGVSIVFRVVVMVFRWVFMLVVFVCIISVFWQWFIIRLGRLFVLLCISWQLVFGQSVLCNVSVCLMCFLKKLCDGFCFMLWLYRWVVISELGFIKVWLSVLLWLFFIMQVVLVGRFLSGLWVVFILLVQIYLWLVLRWCFLFFLRCRVGVLLVMGGLFV